MKKFDVTADVFALFTTQIEAETQEEANQKLRNLISDRNPDLMLTIRKEMDFFELIVHTND